MHALIRLVRTMARALGGGILGAALLGAQAAAACPATSPLYRADFSKPDSSWGPEDDVTIGGGRMSFTEKAGEGDTIFFNGDSYAAATVCADFTLTSASDDDSSAGLTFWSSGFRNYYVFQVDPLAGTYGVERKKDNKWLNPVEWTKSGAIKKGVGAVNELSVTFAGNQAGFAINGEHVADLTGFPPDDPGLIGAHRHGLRRHKVTRERRCRPAPPHDAAGPGGIVLLPSGRDDGQLDGASLGRGVVDALLRFAIVGGLGQENVGDVRLRIAVVEGEPAGLDLDHDPVTR
jgi:hypothetical protein